MDTAGAALSQTLARFGSVNFTQDCVADGHPARLVMTARQVVLAVADGTGTVHVAPPDRVGVAGTGADRTVMMSGQDVAVEFASEDEAQRFARVLGVRREMSTTAAPPVGTSARAVPSATDEGFQGLPMPGSVDYRRATAQSDYTTWAGYALGLSTFLLWIAGIYLLVALAGAGLLLFGDDPLLGLLWLGAAVVGSAVPLCLAALTRVVVYRHRLLDQ